MHLLIREEEGVVVLRPSRQLHLLPILVREWCCGDLKAGCIAPQVQGLVGATLGAVDHNCLQYTYSNTSTVPLSRGACA